ncbi:hypothetical protein E2C01_053026 [Portunus trituberculatus]|uniref:Uncharacterized protein n=1 Tax=Portunus trituberculatus TaxID=210409 RepID=A0A5B7GJ89_PORTR|nr:hypothetical protein [Portunus trituberculatus]
MCDRNETLEHSCCEGMAVFSYSPGRAASVDGSMRGGGGTGQLGEGGVNARGVCSKQLERCAGLRGPAPLCWGQAIPTHLAPRRNMSRTGMQILGGSSLSQHSTPVPSHHHLSPLCVGNSTTHDEINLH